MAEYLSPGVYVEEFDSGMQAMEGVGTSTAGFVGMAEKGPVGGTPVFLTSFADYRRVFGGYLSEKNHGKNRFLPYAVEEFFANGGTRCFVMRVAPKDAAEAGSAGETMSTGLTFAAKNPGKWGNGISVSVKQTAKSKTQIKNVVGDGNGKKVIFKNVSGFVTGDTVALTERKDDGKTEITEYNRITAIVDDEVTFEKEFNHDIASADNDNSGPPSIMIESCELSIRVKCGEESEDFEVSLNPGSASYVTHVLSKSELIKVIVDDAAAQAEGPYPPMLAVCGKDKWDAGTFTVSLKGGSDGVCNKPDDDEYSGLFIGDDNGPGKRTGLKSFLEISNVSIMAIPGITAPAVQLALVAQCESLASRFAVLDMPLDKNKTDDLLIHRSIVDSNYAAMYHPWIQLLDKQINKSAYIPPSGSIAGIYARSDATRGVHKAPANEPVRNALGLSCNYNKGEQDRLNPEGVNLIRALPGQGIRVWGARTCSSNGLWKYVNVRRLFIFIEETLKSQTNWAVFEPNDEVLWMRVRLTISAFLRDLYRSGALVGASEAEAFFVNVGHDTMSQQDILNGRLICVIGVAPSRPAEFVIFRITQNTKE